MAKYTGFSLFLALIIDRMHYYIRELNLLRFNYEVTNKLEHDYKGDGGCQKDKISSSNVNPKSSQKAKVSEGEQMALEETVRK